MSRVLVTGGAGYIGSVLVQKLLVRGHSVRVLDMGMYGLDHVRAMEPTVDLVEDDLTQVTRSAERMDALLADIDVIVHLAGVASDAAADRNPELTRRLNVDATRVLINEAKRRGIRFIFSSSCAVYGESTVPVDEDDPAVPLTLYSRTKVEIDNRLRELADEHWRPVILRNGTLYGYSPVMRFDLVVNIFSYTAIRSNEIRIFGAGHQWRPFLHVADCARAFLHFVENQPVHGLVFNLGAENLRVVDLAEIFRRINPQCREVFVPREEPDNRNYLVSTERMKREGIVPRWTVSAGAEDVVEALVSRRIADPEVTIARRAEALAAWAMGSPMSEV